MAHAGSKRSPASGRVFDLAHCPQCHFSCVMNPRTDFAELYDRDYYEGRGADRSVDYEREVSDHRTVRTYEWRGLVGLVRSLRDLTPSTTWLDYGAGLGGLVRYLRDGGIADAVGFDQGYAASRMEAAQIPTLSLEELEGASRRFDVVTAVEVVEHAVDPMVSLRQMAGVLRSGGVLVVTTGNAGPFRTRLSAWSYVLPDVHVSYFEPSTLAQAMEGAGLTVVYPGYGQGWRDIIRYKVLKGLRLHRRSALERAVPWGVVSRLADRRFRVTAQPVGYWHRHDRPEGPGSSSAETDRP